jgi:hypothetical protein
LQGGRLVGRGWIDSEEGWRRGTCGRRDETPTVSENVRVLVWFAPARSNDITHLSSLGAEDEWESPKMVVKGPRPR